MEELLNAVIPHIHKFMVYGNGRIKCENCKTTLDQVINELQNKQEVEKK